jgi:hypothetical protein
VLVAALICRCRQVSPPSVEVATMTGSGADPLERNATLHT